MRQLSARKIRLYKIYKFGVGKIMNFILNHISIFLLNFLTINAKFLFVKPNLSNFKRLVKQIIRRPHSSDIVKSLQAASSGGNGRKSDRMTPTMQRSSIVSTTKSPSISPNSQVNHKIIFNDFENNYKKLTCYSSMFPSKH